MFNYEFFISNVYMIQILNEKECLVTPRLTGEPTYCTKCQRTVVREMEKIELENYEDLASVPPPPPVLCHNTWKVWCNDAQKHGVKREYTMTLEKMRLMPESDIDKHYPKPKIEQDRPIWSFGQVEIDEDQPQPDFTFMEEEFDEEYQF